jgi:hypothetical protein
VKLVRAAMLALAAFFTVELVYVLARRLFYPYDLEWMEGGMLCHALRLQAGQPVYAAPSVNFVPYLYTAFYPALLSALSSFVAIGYVVGRVVSLLGYFGAWTLGYVFVRREGQSRAVAFGAMAIPLAAFVPTGAWVDLARPDSLFLGLITAALMLGWWKRNSHAGVALAGLLMVLAFFTKQTASPFMAALGVWLLFSNWRTAFTYGATLAAVGLPTLYLSNRGSDGWFWTYVFKLHQAHDFYAWRAFGGTPLILLLLLGPAVLLVPWAILRVRSPALLYSTWIAGFGILAACLGFGTQWAFTNAFIPGIFFPAIAIGVAAGRLVTHQAPRLRPIVVYALLAMSLAVAPGGLIRFSRHAPTRFGLDPRWPTGYDARGYIPTAKDRQAGDQLIQRLRDTPGDVLIPFHPFYAHLAGKLTFLHRMGVLDVTRAGLGAPQGLKEALAQQRFAMVVMDDKIDGNWQMWPGLTDAYRQADIISGPHVVSGAMTQPRYVLLPKLREEREP